MSFLALQIEATSAQAQQLKANLRAAMFNAGREDISGGRSLILRDLNPTDLLSSTTARLTNQGATTANTFLNSDISKVVPQTQIIGIYGWASLSATPHIDQVRLNTGGRHLAFLNMNAMYAQQNPLAYLAPGIIWRPNATLAIDLLTDVAVSANAEAYDPRGFVVEPQDINVSPDYASENRVQGGAAGFFVG